MKSQDPEVPVPSSWPGVRPVRLLHPARSQSQADIWLVDWDGRRCVLRDFSGPRVWYFRLLCLWGVRREIEAHRQLDGIEGIPRLLHVLGWKAYLIEYIEGEPIHPRLHRPGPEFFSAVEGIVGQMHARGVAHGDLRNRNILIGADGNPYLIDFTTAWWATSWWRKPLFRFLQSLDRRRLAVTKARFLPEALGHEEIELLGRKPWYLRLGWFYRQRIYPRLVKREPLRKRGKPLT
ncbi:MAG: hypothetical protein HUU16_17285 [Candidatus Omnitrophica bacterium]|nr:hypothetical protein [Candidatus Omnitrophota bacterium]